MYFDEEVLQQNIVASQTNWQGNWHCPILVVNNGLTPISKELYDYFESLNIRNKIRS